MFQIQGVPYFVVKLYSFMLKNSLTRARNFCGFARVDEKKWRVLGYVTEYTIIGGQFFWPLNSLDFLSLRYSLFLFFPHLQDSRCTFRIFP